MLQNDLHAPNHEMNKKNLVIRIVSSKKNWFYTKYNSLPKH
jgi:hypothetical protein